MREDDLTMIKRRTLMKWVDSIFDKKCFWLMVLFVLVVWAMEASLGPKNYGIPYGEYRIVSVRYVSNGDVNSKFYPKLYLTKGEFWDRMSYDWRLPDEIDLPDSLENMNLYLLKVDREGCHFEKRK